MRPLWVADLLAAEFRPCLAPVTRTRRGARVALVGGRAVVSRGVLPRETFAAQLEASLVRAPVPVEVLPIGRLGLNALESLIVLRQLLPRLDTDVVVLVLDDDDSVPWLRSETWGAAVRQAWLELRSSGYGAAAARQIANELVELVRGAGRKLIIAHYDVRPAPDQTRKSLAELAAERSIPFADLSAIVAKLSAEGRVVSAAEPSPSAQAHKAAASALGEALRPLLEAAGEDAPDGDYRSWLGRAPLLGRGGRTALDQLRQAANEELHAIQLAELLDLAWRQLANVGELIRRFERRVLLDQAGPTASDEGNQALLELGRVARQVLLELEHRLAEPELPRISEPSPRAPSATAPSATAAARPPPRIPSSNTGATVIGDEHAVPEIARAHAAIAAALARRWHDLEASAAAARIAFATVIDLADRYAAVPIPFDESTQAMLKPIVDVTGSFRTALKQTLPGPASDKRVELVVEVECPALAGGLELELTVQQTVVRPGAHRWVQGVGAIADGKPHELRFGLLEGAIGFVEVAAHTHDGWGVLAGPRDLTPIRRMWLDRGGERSLLTEGFFFAVPHPSLPERT